MPEHRTTEIDENFTVIANKTEEIVKASSDANFKLSVKAIADRVRSFVTIPKPAEEVVGEQPSAKDEQSSSAPQNTPTNTDEKTQSPDEEESAVMKMIKEDSDNPAKEIEAPIDIEFPDIQKKMKGILDEGSKRTETTTSGTEQSVEKKIKYESPLDFLRLPKNKYG